MNTVSFVTERNAQNPRSWSGTQYYLSKAIADHFDSASFINVENKKLLRIAKINSRLRKIVTGKRSLASQSPFLAQYYARSLRTSLELNSPDVLFFIASSTALSRLKAKAFVVYTSDATVRLMLDYYPQFTGLSRSSIRAAEQSEHSAITRANLLIYPTKWAATSAITDYGADPKKVHVVPYGANLEYPPKLTIAGSRDKSSPFRMLFVGVNWLSKGADIAISAVDALERRGVSCELTICGCTPPPNVRLGSNIRVVPFLDKNRPEDIKRLSELYMESDCFVLPTRFECYGIVFCEASAFGVPAIATRTGGIPDVVLEGINGFTISPSDDGTAFADKAAEIALNPELHSRLRRSSRMLYEKSLNWTTFAERVCDLIRQQGHA